MTHVSIMIENSKFVSENISFYIKLINNLVENYSDHKLDISINMFDKTTTLIRDRNYPYKVYEEDFKNLTGSEIVAMYDSIAGLLGKTVNFCRTIWNSESTFYVIIANTIDTQSIRCDRKAFDFSVKFSALNGIKCILLTNNEELQKLGGEIGFSSSICHRMDDTAAKDVAQFLCKLTL